ncbi:MAG TPA: ribonuclease Z [Gemmatimonadaceae bacterium]|nr:ribonuclease Z [Gemmatimonadaceae bacterium]
MDLSVRFLGTSASRPTVERNVTSLAIRRGGETFLFDCGEGTQRQMMRYGVSFNVGDIFFTHMHADHILGVTGLIRTMALQGRTEPMRLFGPPKSERLLRQAVTLGSDKQHFPINYVEMTPGEPLQRDGYSILPFSVEHGGALALGLAIVESPRLGRFNPDLARSMGIPEGPLWGQIHKGQEITLPDGRVVHPSELVGPTRSGRKLVFTGDARPSDTTAEVAAGADLLIHEATFADEEAPLAIETGHSTAREAATVADKAGVKRLVLTHISSRYSRDVQELAAEARSVFPSAIVARDGMEVVIPFDDEDVDGAAAT